MTVVTDEAEVTTADRTSVAVEGMKDVDAVAGRKIGV